MESEKYSEVFELNENLVLCDICDCSAASRHLITSHKKRGEMERKRRDEKKMQYGLVFEEGMMVNFTLVPFPLVSFTCRSCSKILPTKKLSNHIMHHLLENFERNKLFCPALLQALPIIIHLDLCKSFDETASQGTR